MAKVKLTARLNGDDFGSFYTADSLELRTERDGRAVYVDTSSGNRIVLEGSDFSYKGDMIKSGEVDDITFLNDNGNVLGVAHNVDLSGERLSSQLLDHGVNAMMRSVLNDQDTVYGSTEADVLFGGRDEEGRPVNPIAGLLVALLAPLAAGLIQMAISRAREFEADRGGAEISGDPEALATALQKIHRYAQGIPMEAAERHPETAQMMIMNPLSAGGIRGLFSTHPSTEERVERLLQMAIVR